MVDVTAFAEKDFDARRWINEACELKPSDDNLEKCAGKPMPSGCLLPGKLPSPRTLLLPGRYLAELELRLHLAAEDVDAALEMDSSRALQRIPSAVQEISHVRVCSQS